MRKAFTIIEFFVAVFIVAIFVTIIFSFVVGYQRSKQPAKVISKNHVSAVTTTGFNDKGDQFTSTSQEKWELVVMNKNGDVYSLSVSAKQWASVNVGDTINKQNAEEPLEK
jgi:uncharacterized protein YpmB